MPSIRALEDIAAELDVPMQPVRTGEEAPPSDRERLSVYDADRWRPSDLHWFPGPHRLAYETWRNRLAAAARASGNASITTHVLRHTAASLWIKAGATPFLVMKAGGWASLDMVSRVYGHLWPSDVVELGRKVDALDWDALD